MKRKVLIASIVFSFCMLTACNLSQGIFDENPIPTKISDKDKDIKESDDSDLVVTSMPTEPIEPTEMSEITNILEPTGIIEPTETPEVTEIPKITEIIEPTVMHEVTEIPGPTEIPGITEILNPTEMVEPTEIPETTDMPKVTEIPTPEPTETTEVTGTPEPTVSPEPTVTEYITKEKLIWGDDWKYADYSKIHTDTPILYYSNSKNRKNIVVAVNAGHGTSGGGKVKTLCHPDGSSKVTGGSTAKGSTYATAVSSGTSFFDGTSEAAANLSIAIILKDMLLEDGYDVLMIRESADVQLDNIARTVYSNQYADCHIALHYDSTETDKGFFYIGVPNVSSYRAMEPVASHWKQHNALGEALLAGVREAGIKICGNGNIPLDLTQTSYSTIPSIDVEIGDRKSDHSEAKQRKVAEGLLAGINLFFFGESEE